MKDRLGFRLPKLEEFIETNLITISPEILVIDAIARMNQPRQSDYHHSTEEQGFTRSSYLLVLSQSQLVGVLTERDIVKLSAVATDLTEVTVQEVMTKNVITFSKSNFQDIYQIISILRQHQIRHLPVVDDNEQLVGMISSEGICRALNPSNLLKLRSIEDIINDLVPQAEPNTSILSLSQLMAEKRQSCVVIVENQLSSKIPIGIVTERDIVQFQILGLDLVKTTAQTVMSTPLICMKPTDSLLSVQQQMQKLRVRRLVVAEESGGLRGTVSFQDMLRVFDTTELYGVISTLKQELNQQTEHLQQEIQQREKSEAMLQENQQLLKLFIRRAPAAIAMLDYQMRYLVVSDRWIEDYQLEQTNIIGLSHYKVFPEIPQRWRQNHQDCLTGKVEVLKCEEDSFIRSDGRTEWLRWELRPWKDNRGQIGGLLMFSEVITPRKQIEQKLFAEKELAQVTLKSIGDAVITTDAVGKVKYINPVAERLTGWQATAAQGKPFREIFQIVDRLTRKPVTNSVDLVLQEHRSCELDSDTWLIARDATEYAIKGSAAPIKNPQEQLVGSVLVFRDVTKAHGLAQKLSWQATHDSLTRLYNRRKFEEQVESAIAEAQNNQSQHSLCFLDLDRFKIVNDSCGHAAGDELLKQVTKLLQQRIRESDIFARLGGDEFGLLLRNCSLEIAQKLAERLRQLIQDFRFAWEGKIFRIGVSIGVVEINSTTDDLTKLLSMADAACYAAKKSRNCVYLFHKQDFVGTQPSSSKQWLETLNRALEDNLFCLYAQKVVPIKDQSDRLHYEILLRLADESELVNPSAFLPIAERYALMPAIDRWVITAFFTSYEAYLKSRQEPGQLHPPTNLYTINLSRASIGDRDFGTFLQEQLDRYSIPAQTIGFEITETIAIANLNNTLTLIEQLQKIGCSIVLDNFGSGMSSLTHLKNLPVDYLKIDGSSILKIASDPIERATVECFQHLSQAMKIKTIAKFVENDAILQCLKQVGIDYAQGYVIEHPKLLSFP
ncbi:EAL domain-containing protein [Pleurocapsales cyanobacterium LEGE 10410]|nr:EAL domain-containing protein [Pleurocapsales cyanobacterium LEGE 10410]